METIIKSRLEEKNVTHIWKEMKDIMNIVKNIIGCQAKNRRHSWMTDEILSLMNDRRKYKNRTDESNYKHIQKLIRTKIRLTKNVWLKQECEDIEKLQKLHDDFNLHKKLKEMVGIYRKKNFSMIVNEENKIVTSIREKKIIWERYITKLFSYDRSSIQKETNNNKLIGALTTKEVIKRIIDNAKK